MKCNLGNGELVSLAGGPQGVVLGCLSGTLWITKGDGVDYLVGAGREFRVETGGSAIVESLGASEFRVLSSLGGAAEAGSAVSLRPCQV